MQYLPVYQYICIIPAPSPPVPKVLTGLSSDVGVGFLNCRGADSCLTNTLCCCGPLTGRLKIVTSPGEPARMCDFGDGGIMDNTGVAAAIARGSTKIMSMVTPPGPFRPPTKAFLDEANNHSSRVSLG